MNLSIFVAQGVSLLYLTVGLGMLFSAGYYKKLMHRLFEDMTAIYVGGLVSLVIGFSLVTYHNIWVKNWTVLVTLIGWLALIKGISILAFPKLLEGIGKTVLRGNLSVLGFVIVVLGLIFGYFGFLAE